MVIAIILSIFKQYWKPVGVVGLLLSLILGSYLKGRFDCAKKANQKTVEDIKERYEKAEDEERKTDRIVEQIRRDRTRNPTNDKRDSCILSNDPYDTNCL